MATLTERADQLERDVAALSTGVEVLRLQVTESTESGRQTRERVHRLEVENATLTAQLAECLARLGKVELKLVNVAEAVPAVEQRADDAHRRIETWDNRLWSLAIAVIVGFVTLLATTVLKK